jgi:AcrR family transcriptional regulator
MQRRLDGPGVRKELGQGSQIQYAVRRRILVVAKHRFARFGYAGTRLQDMAHGADLPLEELRLHFDDKRALLQAVLEEGWESINLRLEDIVLNSFTTREALLSLLALMMKVLQDDEDTARLLLVEGRHADPESGEIVFSGGYRRFQHACTSLVEHGQRLGDIKPSYHPQVVASMLMGAIEGLMRDRLAAEQESSITPYAGFRLQSAFEAYIGSLRP